MGKRTKQSHRVLLLDNRQLMHKAFKQVFCDSVVVMAQTEADFRLALETVAYDLVCLGMDLAGPLLDLTPAMTPAAILLHGDGRLSEAALRTHFGDSVTIGRRA
jgi:hypothetical protein